MAQERLENKEYDEIMNLISRGENFLLSGGAGSGKTFTLVQVIRGILSEYPTSSIACITFTNAAATEISRRVSNDNLRVSTIHEFLWDCIGHFQNEIRKSLPVVINSDDYKMKMSDVDPCPEDYFFSDEIESIKYKEYLRIKSGIISHNEVLELSHYMFSHYPKLCEIVKSRYPFILIDEYQDTSRLVVDIMLKSLSPSVKKPNTLPCIVGFFGDAMQSIYDEGIGDINEFKTDNNGNVHEVKKVQNRRNPMSVIDLANKIRNDGLVQEPSNDEKAPNMKDGRIKEGNIMFLFSDSEMKYEDVRQYVSSHLNWNFEDVENTKELNLTHNMIAGKVGFPTLMEIFNGDKILEYCYNIRKMVENDKDIIIEDGMKFGDVVSVLTAKYGKEAVQPSSKGVNEYISMHQDLLEIALSTPYVKMVNMYISQDQLIDEHKKDDDVKGVGSKRAPVIKHITKIVDIIKCYEQKRYGDFLRLTGLMNIKTNEQKVDIQIKMKELSSFDKESIKDIITKADELGILPIDDKLASYIDRYSYVYYRLSNVDMHEFMNYYEYMDGHTPFSTQHRTKGLEYDNVLVLMESKWNKYNFGYLMGDVPARKSKSFDSVVNRTRKLFYVCCTRAKENLVVFYSCPSDIVKEKAKEWFGNENVVKIDNV